MIVSHSDDYCTATLNIAGRRFRFYYGYEEVDADDQWLFVVRDITNSQEGRVLYKVAPRNQGDDPIEVWANCIAQYMELDALKEGL